jgi:6-phosphogluconolactonase/glucosamine-6-phosphate isomerase/deaminase
MASGPTKAAIIQKALTSPQPTEEIPLTICQIIEQGYVMLDKEAAKFIS